MKTQSKASPLTFLKDVLVCSLGAYGGPEAHFGVFANQMVSKRKYLTENELTELIALTALLPGPSSSQTIVAIGYKQGGPLLALFTMLVWALPVLVVMTLFSFSETILAFFNATQDGLRLIGPMAIGFIFLALVTLGKKALNQPLAVVIMVVAGVLTYFLRYVWFFPLVLLSGGLLTVLTSNQKNMWHAVRVRPAWRYFIVFLGLAVGTWIAALITTSVLIQLFDLFYRYGYLVIGGGQVLVPYMYHGLVEVHAFITHTDFVTGYGLVQGLPGPMFSFTAYAGGIAASGQGVFVQIFGAMISGIAIFLPGLLLIYFIYPIWNDIRDMEGIKVALRGVMAAALGLIASTAFMLIQNTPWTFEFTVVTALTFVLLMTKKVPAPLIVLTVLIMGFLL